ncbi:MAG TPA: hypothetical protein VF846_12255 [Thermoanaerobaculia bacterium]|jgi:hypothetical protein
MIDVETLDRRIAVLEGSEANLRRRANVACAMAGLLFVALFSIAATRPDAAIGEETVLRVRGLIVVDANGVERVHIAAPVPDPMMFGRRSERLGTTSGILLFDADGTERSGYLTSDEVREVFVTLDASPRQQALFLANAEGGANLAMWDNQGNRAQLYALREPRLELRRNGKSVASLPAKEEGAQ